MVLLDLLVASAGVHGGRLSVVTVDHGTRPGSAEDAAFVAARAEELGLACVVARLDLGEGASEDTCRRGRYAAFAALDVDRVALAHHRDDQAETALLALIRGGVSRAELAAWAEARGLRWRDDPTNDSPRFLRNRVRHEVIPLLDGLRAGAAEALARAATHAAQDDQWLEQASMAAEVVKAGELDAAP